MSLTFAAETDAAIPLHAVTAEALDAWRATLDDDGRAWLDTTGFAAKPGSVALMPAAGGSLAAAVIGLGDARARTRDRFRIASARGKLPPGTYRLEGLDDPGAWEEAALGWLLAGYRFDRYKASKKALPGLVAPSGVDAAKLEAIAAGEALTRDLINTPARDMGPHALETALRDLAEAHGASVEVTAGAELEGGFPMIAAVGAAAAEAPRLIDLRWGGAGPRLTLVGKGVCFDTGGLNLKPGASMALMKKDMGGAATAAGLAHMIMALGLPVRLRLLVPAVENAVGAGAFRPGDVLTSRKGLTVEVNNTDAEGRLVLADALALADEEAPELVVSMATLTGAARVALGPDLAPMFCDDDDLAAAVERAGRSVRDPVWRLPFWPPYEKMIEPAIADLDNAPKGGFAGAITAALFLRRFVDAAPRYAHFDIYGWQPEPAPARPRGGVGQGARALLQALPEALSL